MRSSTLALCLSGALVSRTEAFLLLKKNSMQSMSPGKKGNDEDTKPQQELESGEDEEVDEGDDEQLAEEVPLTKSKAGECAQKLVDKACEDPSHKTDDGKGKSGISKQNMFADLKVNDKESSPYDWCTANAKDITECHDVSLSDKTMDLCTGGTHDNSSCLKGCGEGGQEDMVGTADTTLANMCDYSRTHADAQHAAEVCAQKILTKYCDAASSFIQKNPPEEPTPEEDGEGDSEEFAEADEHKTSVKNIFDSGSPYHFPGKKECQEVIEEECGSGTSENSFIQNDSDATKFTPHSAMVPSNGDTVGVLKCGDMEYTYQTKDDANGETKDTSEIGSICPASKGSSGSTSR